MENKLMLGLLAFVSVIVGATLQYIFTRHIEHQKHSRELKSKAYMDYLNSLAEGAQFQYELGTKEQKEMFYRTADAKARICLYGSKEVISAFSKYEEIGGAFHTDEHRDVFTNMVSIMRIDSGSERIDNPQEIQNVILGINRKST